VLVELKPPPQKVFDEVLHDQSNYYRFRLGPGSVVIALGARTKHPGEQMRGAEIELSVCNSNADEMLPYERLISDALKGDGSLFARRDSVEHAWRVVDPLLGNPAPLQEYAPGTWGPAAADALLGSEGGWHNPPQNEPAPC
jgi:glucose-6-phosphate 1-dehydrogenase